MNSKNLKIAQPYSEALLDLWNRGSIDTLINDLNYISSVYTSSKDLEKLLSNPLVNAEAKKNIIKSVFSEKVDNITVRFLLVLCDRARISYVQSIVEKSLELAYRSARIETVKIISTGPLTKTQQEALVSKLKRITSAEQIKLETTINQNLLGGFILKVGSKIIDTSIRGQLLQLSSYLGSPTFDFININ
nr:ATP synthase CF1 delta subunit [Cryptomonas sp. NIES-345]BDA98403.1 ATP synthase CF1 delta subunit [Cryptomonas sp. NIES-1327]